MLRRTFFTRIAPFALALALGTHQPPSVSHAQSVPEACVDALALDGQRWDGVPMEPFTWDGIPATVGELDGMEVTLCRAGGPPEILPITQSIGCVVVGAMPVHIGGDVGCGALREVRLQPDGTLVWIARNTAATNEVTWMPWSGSRFERGASYTACWDDPYTPAASTFECGR